ncbi:MAG: Calx-beta domain-containing protein, partial [Thermoanaerobaculales bacterium]|nr:Calx-beta domain-containing protein [Thermoanaerobaculales bacterium]
QISTNGGVTWGTLPGGSIGQNNTVPNWTRYQISLASYLQAGVRLRFIVTQSRYYTLDTDIYLDDIAIEELPLPVTLNNPDQLTVSSMRLTWNNLDDSSFAAYALYRSDTSTVDTSSTLVTTITDQATTEFTDTNLQARKTYYYKVFFVDSNNAYSPSNTSSATTLGPTLPFVDDFETSSSVWTFTGDWGPVVAGGVGGTTSLGDSPGDLTQNLDTYAVTGVDLTASVWPIVSFDERYDFGAHWGRLEISVNGGGSWTILEAPNLDQTEWVHRRFDLSPWRGESQVWLRFFVDANNNTPTDGWHIDNLFIGENPLAGSPVNQFFDGLESGDGAWLNGSWTPTNDDPYAGAAAILDTLNNRAGNSDLTLVYAQPIDLSSSTDPLLTFQVRGNLPDNNYFRTEVSTDQGLTWQNLADLYISDNWSSPEWVRMQTSLTGYLVTDLRLRFRVYGNYGGDENIFLDNISVGEQTPGAPTLNSPAWGADEPTVRPVLTVNNAIDYQSDPMTYEYQIFDDAGLTNVIAQVPAVAGGIDTTSWTVDVDLLPDTQYWWRARATDDSDHTGPWMDTATFFVQLDNHPPTVPELLAPTTGATLPDLTGRLTWLESIDPDADAGDVVDGYRVRVDDDPAFTSPEIDQTGIALAEAAGALSVSLAELAGSGSLVQETRYYWQVAARDNNGLWSDWSAGPAHFVFGDDVTAPICAITSPADNATITDTPIVVTGTATDGLSGVDMVEISTDGGATWVQAVGADSWTHQWWPLLSGDYQLSCRATDVAGNAGAASAAITVHAELDRTMAFTADSASIDEDGSTFQVQVTLSGARAVEVNADLVVSGTAQAGVDFEDLPPQVRFFPGQTTLAFPVTILDDGDFEGDETIVLELANANLPDVSFGAVDTLTLTVLDDDPDPATVIFFDGFETGDTTGWGG